MMSGCTGAERVRARDDYKKFVKSFYPLLQKFPNFVDVLMTGSYESDPNKQTFGDIDLVVFIADRKNNKKEIKSQLISYFESLSEDVVVKFTSKKYAGRRTYNSGDIVTLRYFDAGLGYSVQIDCIIAQTPNEMVFKQWFLNFDANKQGLLSGLIKTIFIEKSKDLIAKILLDHQGANLDVIELQENQELEFVISSNNLQLRKVTYKQGTFIEQDREIMPLPSFQINLIRILLNEYDLSLSFEGLLEEVKRNIKFERSLRRIKGVFRSIVSVKLGEVNTEKGREKEKALALIEQMTLNGTD